MKEGNGLERITGGDQHTGTGKEDTWTRHQLTRARPQDVVRSRKAPEVCPSELEASDGREGPDEPDGREQRLRGRCCTVTLHSRLQSVLRPVIVVDGDSIDSCCT
jgi:hypothetical protein